MKKENTINKQLNNPVALDGKVIRDIWFDLTHIHHGWDDLARDYKNEPARNDYTAEDVVNFFEQLNTLIQSPLPQTTKKSGVDKRLVFYIYDGNKKLKMVVDLMKNSATVIVTIH